MVDMQTAEVLSEKECLGILIGRRSCDERMYTGNMLEIKKRLQKRSLVRGKLGRMELSGRGSDKVICKERKLLFLHIPKTGGRSIQKCVFGGIKGNPHRRALSLRNKIKSEFSDYLIFSFVRNPWERLVSLYHYLKNGFGNTSQDRELTERVGMLSFEEFAANPAITAELVDFRKEEMRSMLIPQVDYLFDDSGRWLPTFLGRFEQIQEDMNRLCALVGAKTGFGHLNGSEHAAYQMYYSDE